MITWLILSIVPFLIMALVLCAGAAMGLWDMSKPKEEDDN